MSHNPHKKSIVFELLERIEALEIKLNSLENVNTKKYYSLDEFSELTGYSKHTIYKKLALLEKGQHYFKPNGGKLIFDDSAVDFLIKGVNQNGKSLHETRQPIYLGDFLNK